MREDSIQVCAEQSPFPSVALVLVTRHLPQSHGALDALTLRALLHRLRHGSVPLSAVTELMVVHQGLCEAEREYLIGAAGMPITFVGVRPTASLPQCQHTAAETTRAPHIIFAACSPLVPHVWLEEQLALISRQPELRRAS